MSSYDVGSAVKCGICGRDTTVIVKTDREGGQSYDLECRHRNAMCENCQVLVRDDSDTIGAVKPLCRTCNPEAFADNDDE